jgi:LPXTG-motif cell wall-anchored protein
MTIALPPNASAHYTFSQPGTYVFFCTLHGYALMHGTITVTAAEPAPSTTLAAPPTTAPSGVTATTTDPNALASTGGSPDPLIVVALLLLAIGGAAVALSRRKDAEHGR